MKKWILLAMLLATTAVRADESTEELKKQMQMLQQRLEQLEAKQQSQEKNVDEKIAQAVEQKKVDALPDSLKWASKIKFSGDLRYRHESIDNDSASKQRDRNRIRARLKMEAKINDQWDAVLRIASGSSDSPTSTNQTLGDSASDSFSSKEIWLDQAYATYHPDWMPGLDIMLGKMENPFYKVGKNQLIFDGDLSLEGGAASYSWHLSEKTKATLTGGAFWVRERSTDADTSIFGIQAMGEHKLENGNHITGGVSYYDFGNIEGKTLSGINSNGNSTVGGAYRSDYNILEGFGEYGFEMAGRPTAVYGSYVKNIAAGTSDDTAWIIGAKYNKAKEVGSWEVGYNYRDVEKDAVVGGLCDSDFIGGGTNGKGHVFGFKYQIAKNVQAGLSYFMNKNQNTEKDYKMIQADLIFKF